MDWRTKAAAARILSSVPGGRPLHGWMQRHVTKSLPIPEREFAGRLEAAGEHLSAYVRRGGRPLGEATFFEFGAGWDLTVALTLAAAGVRRQYCFDLEPLARADLVRTTVRRLQKFARANRLPPELNELRFDPFRFGDGPRTDAELRTWLETAGITYCAPGDARATGLPDHWVDAATSAATLEHVPPEDCVRILHEMRRILRPGGLLSCRVDLSDHFSHSDPSITPWHFLSLSRAAWQVANAPLVYQNRLRASAFRAMADTTGLQVDEVRLSFPPGVDPALVRCDVHPSFTGWTDREDLLATGLRLVCVAPGAALAPAGEREITPETAGRASA